MTLQRAVDLATESAKGSGGPFGAVVVTNSGHAYEGTNTVTLDNDPTAHAEVNAIRTAAASEGYDLSGSTLYTSCQPCPMCLAAALWARIDKFVYAANATDAAEVGFDDFDFYEQLSGGLETVIDIEIKVDPIESRMKPFKAWETNPSRKEY